MRYVVAGVLAVLCFLAPVTRAATPPGYVEKSALEKREWHWSEAWESRLRGAHPGSLHMACAQLAALPGFFFARYIQRAITSESGYASDFWRRWTGKAIHSFGPTAPGEVTLTRSILGLPPGTYPVTMRYSLANVFLPGIPGAFFRPGLLVIFHVDGKEDVSLFTMPPNGLEGFPTERNPFSLTYTGYLNEPTESMRTVARWSFGRAAVDVFHQRLGDSRGPLGVVLRPAGAWETRYDRTRRGHFQSRLADLRLTDPTRAELLFDILDYDGTTTGPSLGTVSLSGRWVNSRHGNRWFARHDGFDPVDLGVE